MDARLIEEKLCAIKWKEGSRAIGVKDAEAVLIKGIMHPREIVEIIKAWAGEAMAEKAVEKAIESKEFSWLAKDIIIISLLCSNLKLYGKMYLNGEIGQVTNISPSVIYFAGNQFVTGYVVKKDFVYPMIENNGIITNRGQKSLKVRGLPHLRFLKRLSYQYHVVFGE